MKRLLHLLILFFAINTLANAQSPDNILGIWLNADKDAKIEVYKADGKYYGKIVWLLKNHEEDGSVPNRDDKNPDNALKSRPLMGINILQDLVWDADDKEYDDGEIYDPKSGNTYSLYGYIKDDGSLFMKGYIGLAIIGRSTIWTRSSL